MLQILIDDDMSRCTAEEVARLLPLVPVQRREQALRYKTMFGQYCCLRSWEMLDELLRQTSRESLGNVSFTSRNFSYNENGKPYLDGGPFFSISHCKEAIAVAVSDEPVGIDIESIRHADDSLIERVMNENERSLIRAKSQGTEADRMFTRLWTQKEAIVKAQGTGILSFEQLQGLLDEWAKGRMGEGKVESIEKEKYIYSIAYGKLHCFGA
ncbi:MAG: 4'-phosphopantetheinyl transferase superfamily protein [Paludibacteraceae bacterium]|nr:4'-phosphopantetheinyl transferase superfamily protein [Paludibacteraceae bacterium]